MSDLKVSELPKATVIGHYSDGLWFKESNDEWVAIAPRGVAMRISDVGFPAAHGAEFVTEKSDLYFKDYDVVSLPVGWTPENKDPVLSEFEFALISAIACGGAGLAVNLFVMGLRKLWLRRNK